MTDIINPECQDCPLRGNECSLIFHAWKRHQTMRRPELVRLLTTMLSQHLEAHCHQLNPSLDEIDQRPIVEAHKRCTAGDKKPDVVKPVPAGLLPRPNRFSLRDLK